MRIVASADGGRPSIRISRTEWLAIGEKCGWTTTASGIRKVVDVGLFDELMYLNGYTKEVNPSGSSHNTKFNKGGKSVPCVKGTGDPYYHVAVFKTMMRHMQPEEVKEVKQFLLMSDWQQKDYLKEKARKQEAEKEAAGNRSAEKDESWKNAGWYKRQQDAQVSAGGVG